MSWMEKRRRAFVSISMIYEVEVKKKEEQKEESLVCLVSVSQQSDTNSR
jgi:hypothetical protein